MSLDEEIENTNFDNGDGKFESKKAYLFQWLKKPLTKIGMSFLAGVLIGGIGSGFMGYSLGRKPVNGLEGKSETSQNSTLDLEPFTKYLSQPTDDSMLKLYEGEDSIMIYAKMPSEGDRIIFSYFSYSDYKVSSVQLFSKNGSSIKIEDGFPNPSDNKIDKLRISKERITKNYSRDKDYWLMKEEFDRGDELFAYALKRFEDYIPKDK